MLYALCFALYALRITLYALHLLFTFHFSLRATRDWKSESVTNQPTNQRTWVGARDTCVSKNTFCRCSPLETGTNYSRPLLQNYNSQTCSASIFKT